MQRLICECLQSINILLSYSIKPKKENKLIVEFCNVVNTIMTKVF